MDIKENVTPLDVEEIAKSLLTDVNTIRDIKGITTEEMEAVYSIGYNFYNSGAYENAEKVFKFLVLFDHMTPKYWIGMGAVYQATKRYDQAILNYSMASVLELKNPKSQYFAAQCHFAMGNYAKAISALECLRTYTPKDVEEYKEYFKLADELEARMSIGGGVSGAEK